MENKILTKKEQIEIIIDRIREFNKIITALSNALDENLEVFDGIYDIGYEVIPAILEVDSKEFQTLNVDDDVLYLAMSNYITKKEFYEKIDKYFKK